MTLLRDVLPLTAPDEKVFAHAVEQGMVMVTCNRNDFLDLAASPPRSASQSESGMILVKE